MNNCTIAGVISRDPELRNTQGGDSVLGFSVAVSNGKDKDGNWRDSTFFDVSIWGKRATALQPYLSKGDKVTVAGPVTARAYQEKGYLQLNCREITMQGGKSDAQGQHAGQPPAGEDDDFDSIPF